MSFGITALLVTQGVIHGGQVKILINEETEIC